MQALWFVVVHNWALISILITLALLVAVPLLVIRKYTRICLNILRDTEPPLAVAQTGFIPLDGMDVDLYAADGVRLTGTLIRAQTATPRGLIVFAPEFKSCRRSCARYVRPLWLAGYDIFSLDFRGHGDSAASPPSPAGGAGGHYQPRQWVSDREVADLDAALAWCQSWLAEQGRPIEIGLFGISRGGNAAILAAERHPCVKALITDGAFSSDTTLEHFMRKWARIFASIRVVYENHPPEFWRFLRWCVFHKAGRHFGCEFPSVRKAMVRMVPRPLLLIHGGRDGYIPVEQSRLLYAVAPQPKYLWIVPGAKHNQSVEIAPDDYARRTVDFFDRYLANIESSDNVFRVRRLTEIVESQRAYRRQVQIGADRARRRDGSRRRTKAVRRPSLARSGETVHRTASPPALRPGEVVAPTPPTTNGDAEHN